MQIFILHPGKANYPEIDAYTKYFAGIECQVSSGTLADYKKIANPENYVLWCIMGFYPKSPTARFVIHDYRSLSVGRNSAWKDSIKRRLSPRPDLRIFQNESMRALMDFNDGVDTIYLPMGVPDWIFATGAERNPMLPTGTYCYLGEITRERGFVRFIADFLATRRNSDTLVLVGPAEKEISDAYLQSPGILFTGRLAQRDALAVVRNCEIAISTIPYKRPYNVQTPTKLLEYAALGKRIICNDSPSNLNAAAEFGIQCKVTGPDVFSSICNFHGDMVPKNDPSTLLHLRWTNVIGASGIERYLAGI
ncbi:glycosyltransferase family 1 protein [Paraburkholderia sp. UYCP14C]|uniref:glycosyltransferase n=1 Tax=Paraburkholderia sp. UYCP14C TaxID=2511130 RepID=UPI0010202F04|nr:glycosyltransferase [Paraburkholderia sp. UYCP14C]RZF30052.1 glycosyltransferase family 1 protein [Paraburkholderia sp. UYCP14C]